jgi:hypothetical protein
MHPELLRALGQARHEDLLNRPRSRSHSKIRLHHSSRRLSRSRRRMGALLIRAGARLIGDQPAPVELAHE